MPIYEYRCRKCEEVFERIMKVNERGDSLICPHCGEKKPEKILSMFSSSTRDRTHLLAVPRVARRDLAEANPRR